MIKSCPVCFRSFKTRRNKQVVCSRSCRAIRQNQIYAKTRVARVPLPTATTGAISELVVACDLMKKGYEVFRALSASCSCDLAVLKGGDLIRIEVRTGVPARSGEGFYFPKNKIEGRTDHYAVVVGEMIHYLPPLTPL